MGWRLAPPPTAGTQPRTDVCAPLKPCSSAAAGARRTRQAGHALALLRLLCTLAPLALATQTGLGHSRHIKVTKGVKSLHAPPTSLFSTLCELDGICLAIPLPLPPGHLVAPV